MKKALKFAVAAAALLAVSLSAFAADVERGSPEEAVAMVQKARAVLKKEGKDKLIAEVNNPAGQFVKKDMYVFIHNLDGLCVAHGGNPKLVGKNLIDLKDATGYEMVKKFVEVAKDKNKGWVEYKWMNKASKEVEKKSTYLEKDGDLILSVGVYVK